MRTTLNLSDEALARVRDLARQRGQTLGDVASDLILRAFEPREAPRIRNGVPVFPVQALPGDPMRAPDVELVNQLRDHGS